MLRLRPYNVADAETILSWVEDETTYYNWCAGILGKYPLTVKQFNKVTDHMAFTAIEGDEVVGFFMLRISKDYPDEVRFCFVVVNEKKRGMGYGKKMLTLGVEYAKEIYGAKKATLGVFINNENAYKCYKKVGFNEMSLNEKIKYKVGHEIWDGIEMELDLSKVIG